MNYVAREGERREREGSRRERIEEFFSALSSLCMREREQEEIEREGDKEGLYTHSLLSYLFIIINFIFIYEFIFL